MGTTTLIPVEEYLQTSYSPDCEYVDGAVLERNVGEKPHSKLQRNLVHVFAGKYPSVQVWPELRMRTTGTRHRIPDVCVTLSEPETDVVSPAPSASCLNSSSRNLNFSNITPCAFTTGLISNKSSIFSSGIAFVSGIKK